jgi:Protein of unknown function (DUF2442)
MGELTSEEFARAKARGEARMRGLRADSAHYDAGRNRVIVRLTTGVELGFAPRDVEGLEHASVDDLKVIEVEAFGLGIHFPKLGAGAAGRRIGLQAMDGHAAWCAGGRVRSAAKGAASRENGKRGGRPRRTAVDSDR